MRKLFFLGIIALVLTAFTGCYSSQHNIKKDLNVNTERVDSKSSIAILIPPDGSFISTSRQDKNFNVDVPDILKEEIIAYGSGILVSEKIKHILITKYDNITIIKDKNNITTDYIIIPNIYHWEERSTEWSGIADKLGIKIQLYNVRTDKIVNEINYYAECGWLDVDSRTEFLMDHADFHKGIYYLVGLSKGN